MNSQHYANHPLTEADCQTCLRIINDSHPKSAAELKRMEEAGMPVPAAMEQNEANRSVALGILKVYFPDRLNY